MKGIFKGFAPVDYISRKTGEPVKGCTLHFDCRSEEAFGYVGKSEYISESSPIYKRAIEPYLDKFMDESSDIYGSEIHIDYNVTKRGNSTFTDICELAFVIEEKPGKKAG
ncbi:MAG: hypothetical protein J1F11_10230 [Oscillospiraceae bacterium]|nr:hypothetical protein [Oscillospiraceae bacterium]